MSGYKGAKCGQFFYGERDDGLFIQATGSLAQLSWPRLSLLPGLASRIDLRADVVTGAYESEIAAEAATLSERARQSTPHPWKIRYINGYGAGDTTYLGSFSSLSFARVYDKAKESGEDRYRNTWRYEVVYRKESARRVYDTLRQTSTPGAIISSTIHDYFTKRGVRPYYTPSGADPVEMPQREETPHERKLAYLRTAMQSLCYDLGRAGYSRQVLLALPLESLLNRLQAPADMVQLLKAYLDEQRKKEVK